MSKEYDEYLQEHRSNLCFGLEWLKQNLPEVLEGAYNIDWLVQNAHDHSKYGSEEYNAYDTYFYTNIKSYRVQQDFQLAWLHHIHHNPHHWQHWVLINDDPAEGTVCLEMPRCYIIEMICDWWSFSWAKNDLTEMHSAAAAKASEETAALSESAAKESETNAAASEAAAQSSETNAANSESAAKESVTNAAVSAATATEKAAASSASAEAAKASEEKAALSENAAKTSETNAASSASIASEKAAEASSSASAAKVSETNASDSEVAAKKSEVNASASANAAASSETNAKASETSAAQSAAHAIQEREDYSQWVEQQEAAFTQWFDGIKEQFGDDVAGNLTNQINKEEIDRILSVGFADGVKEFSEDGTTIISTAPDGRTLTKTFTNSFQTMTAVLRKADKTVAATLTKEFAADGSTISTTITYS